MSGMASPIAGAYRNQAMLRKIGLAMMKLYLLFSIVSLVPACSNAGGGSGGAASGATATQTANGSTINGGLSNSARVGGSVTGGYGAPGGTSSQNIPVNLALDPSSFGTIFGHSPPIVSPTKPQAEIAKAVADQKGDATASSAAESCLLNLASCTISTVLGK